MSPHLPEADSPTEAPTVFTHPQFGTVRTVEISGEPWFVGKDVANTLGYQNGSRDINRHVDEEDRRKMMIFDGNQNKETIIINESGLYALILSSKLPSAKEFKHWVTAEVLPSIRKNGAYIRNQENLIFEFYSNFLSKKLIEFFKYIRIYSSFHDALHSISCGFEFSSLLKFLSSVDGFPNSLFTSL